MSKLEHLIGLLDNVEREVAELYGNRREKQDLVGKGLFALKSLVPSATHLLRAGMLVTGENQPTLFTETDNDGNVVPSQAKMAS